MRHLTARETDVIAAMIDRASDLTSKHPVTDAERDRWRSQLATTYAGSACGCGTCPSIELTDASGRTPELGQERIVLEAAAPDAMLLLFIDDGQLSYLELAPLNDEPVSEFPEPKDISVSA